MCQRVLPSVHFRVHRRLVTVRVRSRRTTEGGGEVVRRRDGQCVARDWRVRLVCVKERKWKKQQGWRFGGDGGV